jgi:hypothetical protein
MSVSGFIVCNAVSRLALVLLSAIYGSRCGVVWLVTPSQARATSTAARAWFQLFFSDFSHWHPEFCA